MELIKEILKAPVVATFIANLFLFGCQVSLLESDPYDFRKVRWGYTKEMVLASELGKRLHVKTGNLIIYNHAFGHVPAKVIYCFQNNRLTAAGYITDKPVKDARLILKRSLEQHGRPDEKRYDGYRWDFERSIVYANAYVSNYQLRGMPQWGIGGGIIDHLYKPQEEQGGVIRHWDCVWAYIDRNLYDALHYEQFPLDKLSFYEKMLFGVVKRKSHQSLPSEMSPSWMPENEDAWTEELIEEENMKEKITEEEIMEIVDSDPLW